MSTIEVTPLTTHIGAELRGIDLAHGVDDEAFSTLHGALLQHHIVFARDQSLGPAELLALGERFGEILRGVRTPADGFPDVAELVTSGGGDSPDVFHLDGSYEEEPPMASLMTMDEAPSVGGDLLCASTGALYDALSAPMQRLLEGLRVRYEPPGWDGSSPRPEHPLVRIHPETGRKHLFFDGLSSTRVVGLHRHEGQALLQFLRAHLADPTFACRHQWRDGDFVMWDNRATVHRSTGDYAGRRVSHRVTLTRLPGTREQ